MITTQPLQPIIERLQQNPYSFKILTPVLLIVVT
jgi:hypothetical protein